MYKVAVKLTEGYVSSSTFGRWQLSYFVGEWTTSETGIFLFSDIEDARSFLSDIRRDSYDDLIADAVVLEVIACDTWVPEYVCGSPDPDMLDEFYSGHNVDDIRIRPWKSLCLAKAVKPLGEV